MYYDILLKLSLYLNNPYLEYFLRQQHQYIPLTSINIEISVMEILYKFHYTLWIQSDRHRLVIFPCHDLHMRILQYCTKRTVRYRWNLLVIAYQTMTNYIVVWNPLCMSRKLLDFTLVCRFYANWKHYTQKF